MATHKNSISNPLILALETSGRLGSVALAQGDRLLGEKHFSGQMRHSAEVFPSIVELLGQFAKKPADIEQVYISLGPGSFTGLRIAVTIAKTMALANQAKIVAVDTLDVIAANIISFTAEAANNAEKENVLRQNERLATILDAKRGQFFTAVYDKTDDKIWKKVLPDCLMTADEFLGHFVDGGRPVALIGEGLVYYRDKFSNPKVRVLNENYWNPSAANIHRIGWKLARQGLFADPISLTPNYLRQPDVKIKGI
jgi:tRNA threonylcarbamoyladenosine biosynthesis protein TsaB